MGSPDHSATRSSTMATSTAILLLWGLTVTFVSSCQDVQSSYNCATWKRYGYCAPNQKHYTYMKRNCAKTCDLCGSLGTPPPPFPGDFKCGRTNVQQNRVVNGFDAKEGAWPWLGSLQNDGNHWCGSTLITPTWVLTASHCVSSIAGQEYKWKIKMGAHNHRDYESSVQYRKVKRVIMHPSYNPRSLFADHALIEVDKPFQLNSRVTLACLPKDGYRIPHGTQNCYIAGWGSTHHPGSPTHLLQQARMPVVEERKCRHQQEAICVGFGKSSDPNACRGDSGGPMMCHNDDGTWTVHGVASYVVTYCKYYTGYSPIHKYLPWIKKICLWIQPALNMFKYTDL